VLVVGAGRDPPVDGASCHLLEGSAASGALSSHLRRTRNAAARMQRKEAFPAAKLAAAPALLHH
jgi:hypothetical protein